MGHFTLTIIDVPTLLGLFVFFLRHRHPQKALFHDPNLDAQCMGNKFTITVRPYSYKLNIWEKFHPHFDK